MRPGFGSQEKTMRLPFVTVQIKKAAQEAASSLRRQNCVILLQSKHC
jgi:hypothetical protein